MNADRGMRNADCPDQHAPVLSPCAQARYHLGCAWRHLNKGLDAIWQTSWFPPLWLIAMLGAIALMLSGCVTSGNGVRWSPLVPTTWPIFSGESTVNASKRAEKKAAKQDAIVEGQRDEAVHAAHAEVFKAHWVLGQMPPSWSRDLAYRFSGNGLALLDQADQLAAWERDFSSGIAQKSPA